MKNLLTYSYILLLYCEFGIPYTFFSQTRKELSKAEDPFDAPTYNIPEKPVTFTEGASYSLIILAGLGVAAVAAYGVFKELIFEPKEYVNICCLNACINNLFSHPSCGI